MIEDANFHEHVGAENICENVTVGLQRAHEIWDERNAREPETETSLSGLANSLPVVR
jgi:hypothetical protein